MLLHSLADGGPWPCEEKGCPNASVSCALLAKEGACAHPFASIWERSPASIASLKVWEGCPASCSAHGAPKRMYRQTDASFVQFSEHTRGACLAEKGKPMDNSSGRVIHCADTCVPGPPYCTYGARVLTTGVAYVPEAQGSWCVTVRTVRGTRTSLGRAVRHPWV